MLVLLTTFVTINSEIKENNMTPGYAEIVKCPYCGAEKELMTLASGNTIGAEYWSDNKRIAPMLPTVSPIQKCPNCGKYYFEYEHRHGKSKNTSFERGELALFEWKEAYNQFLAERINGDHINYVRLWVIQSYNDYFYRSKDFVMPSEEDFLQFSKIVAEFIHSFNWESVLNPLLKAELYREANLMKECKEVLDSIPFDKLNDYEKNIFNDIKRRMENNDKVVFKLHY